MPSMPQTAANLLTQPGIFQGILMFLRMATLLLLITPPHAFAKSLEDEVRNIEADINYLIGSWTPSGMTLHYSLGQIENESAIEKRQLMSGSLEVRDRMGRVLWGRELSTWTFPDVENGYNEEMLENFRYTATAGSEASVYQVLLKHPEFSGQAFRQLEETRRQRVEEIWAIVKNTRIPPGLGQPLIRYWAYKQALWGLMKIGVMDASLTRFEPTVYPAGNVRDNLTIAFINSKKTLDASIFYKNSDAASRSSQASIVEHSVRTLASEILQHLRFRPSFFDSIGMHGSPLLDFPLAACNDIERRLFIAYQGLRPNQVKHQ